MNPSPFKAVLIGLSSLLLAGVASAADIEAGKEKTVVCQSCHGPDGNSANPIWPKLAGQHASYILKQLREFKAGKRQDPTMQGMVAALTDEDMVNIAAYYQSLALKAPANFDQALVAKGQDIYRGGIAETSVAACMGCHGPSGSGNPAAKFPALGSQHAAYVVKTMKDFRSGARSNDTSKMMQNIATRMTDREIEAVASYISGLH